MKPTTAFNRLSDDELSQIRELLRKGKASEVQKTRIVEDMAYHHCTMAEIGTMLGVRRQYIEDHYRDVLNRGHVMLKHDIRRFQYENAKNNKGNGVMLIWLGKQYLEQSETPQLEIKKDQFDEFIEWISQQKMQSSLRAQNKLPVS